MPDTSNIWAVARCSRLFPQPAKGPSNAKTRSSYHGAVTKLGIEPVMIMSTLSMIVIGAIIHSISG